MIFIINLLSQLKLYLNIIILLIFFYLKMLNYIKLKHKIYIFEAINYILIFFILSLPLNRVFLIPYHLHLNLLNFKYNYILICQCQYMYPH